MPIIRASVNFVTRSGIPRDNFTNTLWFDDTVEEGLVDAATDLLPIIQGFYTDVYDTISCANYVAFGGDTTSVYVDFVDWSQPTPRVPYRLNFGSSAFNYGSSVIPTEVAAVLSFQAAEVPGQRQERRRGRIYIPGVRAEWLTQSPAGAYPTFNSTVLTNLTGAAQSLQAAAFANLRPWVVYSRVNGSVSDVTNGWVDNSPDTQRRRSVDAASRTAWAVGT